MLCSPSTWMVLLVRLAKGRPPYCLRLFLPFLFKNGWKTGVRRVHFKDSHQSRTRRLLHEGGSTAPPCRVPRRDLPWRACGRVRPRAAYRQAALPASLGIPKLSARGRGRRVARVVRRDASLRISVPDRRSLRAGRKRQEMRIMRRDPTSVCARGKHARSQNGPWL